MTVARTVLIDWLFAAGISTAIIYSFLFCIGVWSSGVSPEPFGNSAFFVFMGYAGIPISLVSYSYVPELVPIFIGLIGFWYFVFWLTKQRPVGRSAKITIRTICLLSLWSFGMVGIAVTQVV
jgi:hypothetical protein